MSDTESTIHDARDEMDQLLAMANHLPDDETVRLTAARIKTLVSLFDTVMRDAVEHAEQNRSLKNAVEYADKTICRLQGMDPKEPLL
jgi:hypothetical protein